MCDSVTGSLPYTLSTKRVTSLTEYAFFESCTAIGRGRLTVVPAGKKFPRYFEISTHFNTSSVHCITALFPVVSVWREININLIMMDLVNYESVYCLA